MKKTVNVTIEHLMEVEIDDGLLTPEYLEHFNTYFHEVESTDDLFRHAAEHIARFGERFVEGLGGYGDSSAVCSRDVYYEVQSEIVDD